MVRMADLSLIEHARRPCKGRLPPTAQALRKTLGLCAAYGGSSVVGCPEGQSSNAFKPLRQPGLCAERVLVVQRQGIEPCGALAARFTAEPISLVV